MKIATMKPQQLTLSEKVKAARTMSDEPQVKMSVRVPASFRRLAAEHREMQSMFIDALRDKYPQLRKSPLLGHQKTEN